MSVTKSKIAMTTMLMAMTCGLVCLTRDSSRQAKPSAPSQASPPNDDVAKPPEKDAAIKDAKMPAEKTDKMFPDGLVYDFGKVQRGAQAQYAFRVVNTADVPLHILSVRRA